MTRLKLHSLVLLILTLIAPCTRSEDIDVFKAGGSQDPSPPNVLIFLDNTSNWSANNQAWKKTEVTTKCNNDATCLSYVNQIFGANSSLTQGQVEVASLQLVLNQLVCNVTDSTKAVKINVGLMMLQQNGVYSNNAGSSTANGTAGVITRAILPLGSTHCANILSDLNAIFTDITSPTYKVSSSANYGGAMFDAFKYFGGYTNPAGASSNTAGSPTGHIGYGPLRYGIKNSLEESLAFTDAPADTTYKSPAITASSGACGGKNYILLVGNTWPNSDDTNLLPGLNYAYSASTYPFATGSQPRLGDVWANFLATTDVSALSGQQTILTSVMNIYNASPDISQTSLLKSMAKNGGGNYYEVGGSLGSLISSFQNFFTSINAQNSIFTQPALAQSATYQGTVQNQLYAGMFRPDKNPLWYGNLKLYQFVVDASSNLVMADSQGTPIQSTSGSIIDTAISYWTHTSTFWNFRCGTGSSAGDPALCGNPISSSDAPDGAVAEKGGEGQMLREAFTAGGSNSNRKVYTCKTSCITGTALSSTKFDTSSILPSSTTNQSTFGATANYINSISGNSGATGEVTDIINWLRGVDNLGSNSIAAMGARPSMPGDVLHSRAVVVNYNTSASGCSDTSNLDKNVVAYYGSNHGMLHAIKGGTSTASGAGQELWSFVPPEFFGALKRLHDNSPPVTFPIPVPAGTNPVSENASPYNSITASNIKPHLLDGNLTVLSKDANGDCKLTSGSGDIAYLFATMRRGGRFIYAFNIIDPDNPVFLWKKSHNDAGFNELGETWSELTPFLLADGTPAVIFGAGYDPGADDLPLDTANARYQTPTTSPAYTPQALSMGRGIFILNAATGAIIKSFGTSNGLTNSIPSNVTIASNMITGIAKQAYVGDTGGYLWRVSFLDTTGAPTTDPSKWTLTKIASLGNPSDTYKTGPYARKFLFAPSVVSISGGYALMIGSGDREKPFDTTVLNNFYMVKDTGSGFPIKCEGDASSCDLFNATNNLLNPSASTPIPSDAKGWYISLGTGEKTVGSAATVSGVTYFPTNQANSNAGASCSAALGTSKMWAVDFTTATAAYIPSGSTTAQAFALIPTGGFPASPTLVTVQIPQNGSTTYKSAVVSPPGFQQTVPTPTPKRSLLYHYRENLD